MRDKEHVEHIFLYTDHYYLARYHHYNLRLETLALRQFRITGGETEGWYLLTASPAQYLTGKY